MGRVINTESAGKERTQLTKAVVLALRELMKQQDLSDDTRDLAAFIGLSLSKIMESVEVSVVAWEKRDYWVKADRFRVEWMWSGRIGSAMCEAVLNDDWATVARLSAEVGQKLAKVKVPLRHRMGTPWVGAWDELIDARRNH